MTPEAEGAVAADADRTTITRADMVEVWTMFNDGPAEVELVAIGNPHVSASECRALADALGGRKRHESVAVIVTAGRDVMAEAGDVLTRLREGGVQVLPDLCWCSISSRSSRRRRARSSPIPAICADHGPGLSGRTVPALAILPIASRPH